LPPNWNVGVGITLRRQNSETKIKAVVLLTVIKINDTVWV